MAHSYTRVSYPEVVFGEVFLAEPPHFFSDSHPGSGANHSPFTTYRLPYGLLA